MKKLPPESAEAGPFLGYRLADRCLQRGRGSRGVWERGIEGKKEGMVHGDVTLDVIKTAGSWSEGLNTYQQQKMKTLHKGPTPMPHHVCVSPAPILL